MKIAINTKPLLSPLTGIGRYTDRLAWALSRLDRENEYTYYYGFFSDRLVLGSENNGGPPGLINRPFRAAKVLKKIPVVGRMAKATKRALFELASQCRSFDLYFEPNFIPESIRSRRTVVTVHDFSCFINPKWQPKQWASYVQQTFPKKIKRADRIIVDSDFIKNEAVERFGFPEEKLIVIHLGVDGLVFKPYGPKELEAIKETYRLPERFILSACSIEPRKNLEGLINAYTRLDERIRKDTELIFVGFKGWRNKRINELIHTTGGVRYMGYVPEDDLAKLYNLATVFTYPSFYEGFGLPPLEAMACGCPVVVSNTSAIPEVCGDAACYVDPHNIDDIAAGLARVLDDDAYRDDLVVRGLTRAGRFTWEKSAKEHIEVFKECMGERGLMSRWLRLNH